jgi:hypothetical protein
MAKRVLDPIDLEAERQGEALRRGRQQQCKPFGFNKRTHKERKTRRDGEFRQQCRIIRGIRIMLEQQ